MNTKLFMVALFTLLAFMFSNAQSQELDNKLIEAAKIGDVGGVTTWIKEGANVNAKDLFGNTALLCALQSGNIPCVDFILTKGADVNAIGVYGYTPLIYSASHGYTNIVRVLIENKAEVT
jgi:ankyrin repeat protein